MTSSSTPTPPPGASRTSGQPKSRLGIHEGRLAPCSRRRNCVSSQAKDTRHRIAPLVVEGTMEEAIYQALRAIESMSGARVVTMEGPYLHAEFTSWALKFVDDLELLYDEPEGILQVRSASRVGNWDLGANRRRVESLRRRLAAG